MLSLCIIYHVYIAIMVALSLSNCLKVLSSKTDLAKSGVILRIFFNRKGAMTFNVYHSPPILGHPFKVLERLLVFLLEILKPIGIAEMKDLCAFVTGGTRPVVLIGGTEHCVH